MHFLKNRQDAEERRETSKALPFLLVCLTLLVSGRFASAADAELKKPYLLRVVLHVADHPLLTPVFRDRVARELESSLQGSLGDLARVSVVKDHPRLADVLKDGLKALGGWNERSEYKDHFVLISYSGVHYEIEARQHDGLTGLASPVVRKDRTRDRDFVARTAALLVDRDFGPVGTFASWPSGEPGTVRLELKGGGLGVPLSRWVKKGDVFAIAQVPASGGPGQPVESAILVVQDPPKDEARDGVCTGRLFHRFLPPSGSASGYRCLKLAALRGPVRLRFVTAGPNRTLRPLAEPLSLEIRRHGFEGEKTTLLTGSPDSFGIYDSSREGEKGLFENVAFVTVLRGGSPAAKVPVALVDDQPTVIPIAPPGSTEAGSVLAYRKRLWERNVSDSCLAQASLFKQINDLTAKPEGRAEALKKAEEGKTRFQEDYDRLSAERDELRDEANKLKGTERPDLTPGEQGLKQLKEGATQLGVFLTNLKKIEKEENAPERKEWQIQLERARTLIENEADYAEAIKIYEKVKATGYKDPTFLQRLDELKRLWETEDADLKNARYFIFSVWPNLDTAGLKGRMDEARKAFEVCKAKGDLIGPQRLFKSILNHNARLTKEFSNLKPEINLEDVEPAKIIQEVNAALAKLATEVKQYLEQKAPK
jgi:hypothetical protein